MESIQVPDQVAVGADMHEVQVHVRWDEYDIALPVHVARLVADAAAQLVEGVGDRALEAQRERLDSS
jgi:hypothetical protein